MNQKLSQLNTEQWNTHIPPLETLDTLAMVSWINAEDQSVAHAVQMALPQIAQAIDLASMALEGGGRMLYVGAGTSGRLGLLDAAECPPTFNVQSDMVQGILAGGEGALKEAREGVEDSPEAGAEDLASHGIRAQDVVVGLAASGRTPYVLGALQAAREVGAATISLSCNPEPELALFSDVTIAVDTGPEVILGSTRLKAGSAQKMILNMISTGVMVRLGKTYRNLMIDMRATNEKLIERARRIVMLAADIEYDRATQVLNEAKGVSKVAILMARCDLSRAEATALLADVRGHLDRAIAMASTRYPAPMVQQDGTPCP